MDQATFDGYMKNFFTTFSRPIDFECTGPYEYVYSEPNFIHRFEFHSDHVLYLTSYIHERIEQGEDLDKMIEWVNEKSQIGQVMKEEETGKVKCVVQSMIPDTMSEEEVCQLIILRLLKVNTENRDDLLIVD